MPNHTSEKRFYALSSELQGDKLNTLVCLYIVQGLNKTECLDNRSHRCRLIQKGFRDMSELSFSTVDSGLGKIYIVANKRGVSNIFFGRNGFHAFLDSIDEANVTEGGKAEKFARELRQYLKGKRSGFKSALDLSSGTRFQRAV